MKSLLLMSVMLASVAIPLATALDRNPRRGLKRMLLLLLVFNLAYVLYLTRWHPVLFVPHW